ncbi:hypothetical protein MKW94_006783 [Papaver nudicaule]|uniref:Kinesin motor domain-containing protein n=1 Tax=Papaver nudicaule TaxID=74823 RepID=A0AA41SKA5_PAPNU|nr:hypothetical protein [Papaver nudicaule]
MAQTPSTKKPHKTPQSKKRFGSVRPIHPSLNPNSQHPIQVIGRIRNYPTEKPDSTGSLHVSSDDVIRVRTEIGYRDFTLDGVSVSEEEDLQGFYEKYVGPRVKGVKTGGKFTILTYGPTGSGKSHTMFGPGPNQPGIVYKALEDILGNDHTGMIRSFVQVSVMEIFNEEIYDLLPLLNGCGTLGHKGNSSKVRLEVMGKKVKDATFITGNEAGKIAREVAKVEKRRSVKSTNCNDRSSRSHCIIILDVPLVGGRLMLVDMAGSENIEQAGQVGFEAKMQTAKINQGNIALKRVVESIANGDAHVPFRDSKLTMLLQDSFEDDESRILMILCASPDPKEMHKTMATLEYGAKAKCIVRGCHTPTKHDAEDSSSQVILASRIAAMDDYVNKLQMEIKRKEKETNEAHSLLMKKEEEVAALRTKIEQIRSKAPVVSEEEINLKVKERTQNLKRELDKKVQDCLKAADDFVEMGRRRMEEKILQQQEEVEMLRWRLEVMESELIRSNVCLSTEEEDSFTLLSPLNWTAEEDSFTLLSPLHWTAEEDSCILLPQFPEKVCMSTEEEAVEEKAVQFSRKTGDSILGVNLDISSMFVTNNESANPSDAASARKNRIQNIFMLCGHHRELTHHVKMPTSPSKKKPEADENNSSPFLLNQEHISESLVKEISTQTVLKPEFKACNILSDLTQENTTKSSNFETLAGQKAIKSQPKDDFKEKDKPEEQNKNSVDVVVKWETSTDYPGKFITKLTVTKDSSLADLRKLIVKHLDEDHGNHGFTFLMLGDHSGAPVAREKETTVQAINLPICNNLSVHLACLRVRRPVQRPTHLPFTSLGNTMLNTSNYSSPFVKHAESFSPKVFR